MYDVDDQATRPPAARSPGRVVLPAAAVATARNCGPDNLPETTSERSSLC
jgi:hypothetical protein